jgi:hypothetical protein
LVGLLTYGLLLLSAFLALRRAYRFHPSPQARPLALSLGAGILAYLLNGLTVTNYVLLVITIVLTLYLALAAELDAESKP